MSANTARAPGAHAQHAPDAVYYPWFDWLRAFCACAVMWYHGKVLTWIQAGNFPVQIFFALSGWLIGGILLKTTPAALPRFYFNRAVRIWTPYYLAAAILLTLSVLREPITAKWIEIVIYKLTFVYNLYGVPQLAQFHDAMPQKGTLSHFWSVNVEEQFYLAAPLFLVLLWRRIGHSPLLWIVLAWLGFPYGLGAITLGVLAATVVDRFGPIHRGAKARALMLAGLVGALVLLPQPAYYELAAPFAGVLIVLLLAIPGEKSKVGAVMGGMSYPLYLNHWIGIFGANAIGSKLLHSELPIAASAALQLAINLPLAIGLYWFIDRKLLTLRAGWYSTRRATVITVIAYSLVAIGIAYGHAMQQKAHLAEQVPGGMPPALPASQPA